MAARAKKAGARGGRKARASSGIGPTRVVNVRGGVPCDVYCGRESPRTGHAASAFANPFTGRDALVKFDGYFYARLASDPAFRAAVLALRGKRLGCWCYPRRCHVDEIAEYVDGWSTVAGVEQVPPQG